MDSALQARRSIQCCGSIDYPQRLSSVKPVLGLCSYRPLTRYSKSHSWCIKCPSNGASLHISASSEYSKRRPRKSASSSSSSRARGSGTTSKRFIPKAPLGKGTQKRSTDGDDDGEGENSVTSTNLVRERAPEIGVDSEGNHEIVLTNGIKVEGQLGNETNGKIVDLSTAHEHEQLVGDGRIPLKQNGIIHGSHESDDNQEIILSSTVNERSLKGSENDEKSLVALVDDEISSLVLVGDEQMSLVASDKESLAALIFGSDKKSLVSAENSIAGSALEELDAIEEIVIMDPEEQIQTADVDEITSRRDEEDPSHKLKLEMEQERIRQVIAELAEASLSTQNRLFTYPEVIKPGTDVQVFFNMSLSVLKDEPDVLIMGAFNDWGWKSFTTKLDKNNLNGDWWSSKIHVPEEAYNIDFVFFNGKNVYDNNNRKDFHIDVIGGMDAASFEEFLLEKKRRELEQLAMEEAEKERRAEEQRRLQEDRDAIEAHRAQAKAEVEREKAKYQELIKAAESHHNLWYMETCEVQGLFRLFYNRSTRPLAHANEIWIHGGINNWRYGLSISAKLVKSDKDGADWWYTEVEIPDDALVLDCVFADGPPKKAVVYDNNNRQDFHSIVPKPIPDEQSWAEEEEIFFQRLEDERRKKEEFKRAKAKKTAEMRAVTKENSLKRFLMSQKHIVYTDPFDVQAGEDVTVYYNPANTVLSGKPEVWFRGSFNRWSHHKGPLAPEKMVPAGNGSLVRTTVKVPLDAYIMDFVFSEKEEGGIFDNKDRMDYHVPVFGGITKEPPMHVVHIAVEMAPIAKVGGLGDVVTSLSRAVQDLNHHVDIILPKYNCMNLSNVKEQHYKRSYHWGGTEIKVWFGKVEGLSVYFLEPCNGFFWTGCIYGCRNDAERFSFFCHAALEFLKQNGSHPDIIHCHDWSSAPVAWLFKEHYQQYGLSKTRIVFTIHNLEFGVHSISKAMTHSDKATTVSETYSREVAANPAIAANLYKFHGIINGIDPDIWDPYNDRFIPVPYTSENAIEGKRAAKETLQRKLGLKVSADMPLIGVISRLTHQKGIHLIKHAIWRTLDRNGQFILLGSAPDPRIQNDFVSLANQLHSAHNDRARLCLTYDEPLSHLIYAAADFILVPSLFEPCGLTQLVAMRYGAIPVVRKTGGLYDTVFDVDHDKERAEGQGLEPNGFNFEGADASGVDYALNRALSAYFDGREWFQSLCKRVMEQDWSWNRPALDYLELYHAVRKY
ncbi:hypothetical protein V2J09_019310 [Rumex salicifolius]